jgi:hypothetical protein
MTPASGTTRAASALLWLIHPQTRAPSSTNSSVGMITPAGGTTRADGALPISNVWVSLSNLALTFVGSPLAGQSEQPQTPLPAQLSVQVQMAAPCLVSSKREIGADCILLPC